jgi:hypothetical protein
MLPRSRFGKAKARPVSGKRPAAKSRPTVWSRLRLEELEPRLAPAIISWKVDANGNWETASNWSTGTVPGAGDVAVINRSVPVTVTMGSTDTVAGIQTGTGQTLLVAGGANLTITSAVTDNGTIELQPNASGSVVVPFRGNVTLAGTGEMLMDPGVGGNYVVAYATAGSTVTNAAGHTVRSIGSGYFGASQNGTVVNQGLLVADGGGLTVNPAAFTNSGTAEAIHGGGFEVGGGTSADNSAGSMTADGSSSALYNFGTITGGPITLTNGSTLYNGNSSGDRGTIAGASLDLGGGSTLTGTGTLSGITVPAGSDLEIAPTSYGGNTQTLTGTITDNGMIELAPTTADVNLGISGNVTLTGTGQLQADAGGANPNGGSYNSLIMLGSAGDTLTNGAGFTVGVLTGGSLYLQGGGTVVNQGLMQPASGATLAFENQLVTNDAAMKTSGGQFFLQTTLDNSGGHVSLDGGVLYNIGTVTGGTITVGGGGKLENSDYSNDHGLISGSTVAMTGGSYVAGDTGTFSNITVPAGSDLLLAATARQALRGTITVDGTIELDPTTADVNLGISGNVTLTGTGQLLADALGANSNGQTTHSYLNVPNGDTVTVAAGFTVQVATQGELIFDGATVVNQGLMQPASGGTLVFENQSVTNDGTFQTSGGQFYLETTLDNSGGQISLDGGALYNIGRVNGGTTTIIGNSRVQNGDFSGDVGTISNATLATDSGTQISGRGALSNVGIPAGSELDLGNVSGQTISGILANSGVLTLQNTPTFSIEGSLANSGNLTIGAGSTLTIGGGYTQTSSGSLDVQLGGPPAGGDYSRLNVSGSAALDGTLAISETNGYVPRAGDSFRVMGYPQESGSFATIQGLNAGRSEVLEAVVGETGVRINSLIDAADLAVSSITAPAGGVPGQAVAITYTVQNTQNFATSATSWVDSVYLARGTVLDASSKLIGRVQHNGSVAGGGTYSETLTAPLPGVVPGNYHVIVICDSRGLVPDVNRANNTLASTAEISVDMSALTPGVPASGTIDNGQDIYYRVDLPAGPLVRITANFAAPAGGAVYVRYQDVPDQATYDQVAFDPTQAQQQIVLNGTQAGTYYILLHGREGSTGGQPYSITVQEVPFQILSVTPNQGSNAGQATLTVLGSELSPTTTVSLVGPGGSTRPASQVLYKDSTTLFATFDLTGLAPGSYAVQIQDHGQTATDPGAFTVNNGAAGQVSFNLTCSAYTNYSNPGTITIDYTNTGNTDLPAPLMILSADTNVTFLLPGETTPIPGSVQLLGINQNGPAGILPPGYHGTITLSFNPVALGAHQVTNFTLSTIPSPDTPFDWSSVESDLQPPDVPNDAWAAIYQNFTAAVGNTLGQYQQVLDNDATYLSQLGEYTRPRLSQMTMTW